MTQKISGIQAAWSEHDGLGELSVIGRKVRFDGRDGYRVEWSCNTANEAAQQVRLFRAALNHPETRPRNF